MTRSRQAAAPSRGGSTAVTDAIARQDGRGPLDVGRRGQLEFGLDDGAPVAERAGQLGHGPDADQAPSREDPDPIADRLDLGQQVARQHDRQAAFADEAPQQGEDLVDAQRVDRGGGFVEDEQVGRLDQGIGDAQPLAHPARIGVDRVVGAIGQANLLEDFVDGRFCSVTVESVEARGVAQVLAPGQPAVEPDGVGQVADPPLHGPRVARGIETHDRRRA